MGWIVPAASLALQAMGMLGQAREGRRQRQATDEALARHDDFSAQQRQRYQEIADMLAGGPEIPTAPGAVAAPELAALQYTAPERMAWESAREQAAAQLAPGYDREMRERLGAMDRQATARGFFGQMPTAALRGARAADMEAQKHSAIAALAGQVQDSDWQRQMQAADMDMRHQTADWQRQQQNWQMAQQAQDIDYQRQLQQYQLGQLDTRMQAEMALNTGNMESAMNQLRQNIALGGQAMQGQMASNLAGSAMDTGRWMLQEDPHLALSSGLTATGIKNMANNLTNHTRSGGEAVVNRPDVPTGMPEGRTGASGMATPTHVPWYNHENQTVKYVPVKPHQYHKASDYWSRSHGGN